MYGVGETVRSRDAVVAKFFFNDNQFASIKRKKMYTFQKLFHIFLHCGYISQDLSQSPHLRMRPVL